MNEEGILDVLIDIRTALEGAAISGNDSSIAIEDQLKGPKITTKHYVDSPLTYKQIDEALSLHGYAHREAQERALNGWEETLDQLQKERADVA